MKDRDRDRDSEEEKKNVEEFELTGCALIQEVDNYKLAG